MLGELKGSQMLNPPFPELDDLLHMMGQAGRHLAEIEASEGAAGNISVCLRWPVEPRTRFPVSESIDLPQPVPELAGATFLVSGSGRRLREILDEPTANIACLVVNDGGKTGTLYTAFTAASSMSPANSIRIWPCITTRWSPPGRISMP